MVPIVSKSLRFRSSSCTALTYKPLFYMHLIALFLRRVVGSFFRMNILKVATCMNFLPPLIAFFTNLSLILASGLGKDVPPLSSKRHIPNLGHGAKPLEHGHFSKHDFLGVRAKRQNLAFDKTHVVANKIHVVIKQLKSFIHKTYFAHLEFKEQMANFESDLSEIFQSDYALFQKNQHLRFRFDFASTVLSALKRATHDMEVYNFLGETDQHLLNCMIELNIRLFAFHDSIGSLDRSVPMYASRINTCWNQLALWSEAFYKIPEISGEIREVFEFHRIRAYSKIAEFWKQIPYGLYEP